MKVVDLPIGDVNENPDNPRKIDERKFEKLKASLREFPKMLRVRPIALGPNNTVLGGNMRLRAAREIGLETVPCVYLDDFTPEERRRFVVADNKDFGHWDFDALANIYGVEELEAWGFDRSELGLEDTSQLGTTFGLPDGDKPGFTQMTFTLASGQAEDVKRVLEMVKKIETSGFDTGDNENMNGNALHALAMLWEGSQA